MNIKGFITVGSLLGVVAVMAVSAGPAMATSNPAMTSLAFTETSIRSFDPVDYIVNGQPSGTFSFTGCGYENFGDQMVGTQQVDLNNFWVAGLANLPPNWSADPIVYTLSGWTGATCPVDGVTPPVGAPTYTALLTITPQLEIDSTTLKLGQSASGSVPFSTASATGVDPFGGWTSGASFGSEDDASCSILFPQSVSSTLPDGITIDDTVSAPGEAPTLKLEGTPAPGSAGNYKTCVSLSDANLTMYAWLNITVEGDLAETGISDGAIIIAAGSATFVTLLGIALLIRRRVS